MATFFFKVAKNGDGAKVLYTNWLMKSEPDTRLENGVDVKFGLEDLKKSPKQTACWDGVRNYQVNNVHYPSSSNPARDKQFSDKKEFRLSSIGLSRMRCYVANIRRIVAYMLTL